jgi:hypothetical protein
MASLDRTVVVAGPNDAVCLLLNLEAAQRGRSMLFSDEQKLLFKGGKKGFVMNTKIDFMRRYLNLE